MRQPRTVCPQRLDGGHADVVTDQSHARQTISPELEERGRADSRTVKAADVVNLRQVEEIFPLGASVIKSFLSKFYATLKFCQEIQVKFLERSKIHSEKLFYEIGCKNGSCLQGYVKNFKILNEGSSFARTRSYKTFNRKI